MLLIIAGFDPISKAGILADVSIASKIGVPYSCCISTNTIQTEDSFIGQFPTDPSLFKAQLTALLESVSFTAVKLGFLPDIRLAKIVCELIHQYQLKNVVVDPVIVGKRRKLQKTSNQILVTNELLDCYMHELFPLASLVTPNWKEACVLIGCPVGEPCTPELMENKAKLIASLGKCNVLISGKSIDNKNYDCLVHYQTQEIHWFEGNTFISDKPIIGLGCRFSTAIACYLSKGFKLEEAVENAKLAIDEYLGF